MVVNQLFAGVPSAEVSAAVAEAFGLASLDDGEPFSRADIVARGTPAALETLRPVLSEVYIPCKAAIYVEQPITPERCLTILRHFLKAAGMHLAASDMNFDGRRTQVYRIHKDGSGVVRMSRGSSIV